MIWGIGTGRCGTKSYANQIGGVHEAKPRIYHTSYLYYKSGGGGEALLMDDLREHMNIGKPLIHNRYSFVIPVIKKIDFSPEFHWLIREPKSCIESMYRYGFYTDNDSRICQDDMKDWSRLRKLCWYYTETNRIIKEQAIPRKLILTETLTEKINVSDSKSDVRWDDDIQYLDESIKIYEDILNGDLSCASA